MTDWTEERKRDADGIIESISEGDIDSVIVAYCRDYQAKYHPPVDKLREIWKAWWDTCNPNRNCKTDFDHADELGIFNHRAIEALNVAIEVAYQIRIDLDEDPLSVKTETLKILEDLKAKCRKGE